MTSRALFLSRFLLFLIVASGSLRAEERERIFLARDPSLSPDGETLVFTWGGDIWKVPSTGGVARQLTRHPAEERQAKYSPDGELLAFISDREGRGQPYVMRAAGGEPRRVGFHSQGYELEGWYPDGKALLVSASRDHFWTHRERFFRIDLEERNAEKLIFDAYGRNASLSRDGSRLLFTREGVSWWRKGYRGSGASRIWLYDLRSGDYRELLAEEEGCRWPLWRPDGRGFYYVSARGGSFNLWERDMAAGTSRQLTRFADDSVVFPAISRDGSTIVFRHLFDLYRYDVGRGGAPRKIEISCGADLVSPLVERRTLSRATEVAFSRDGLEIALIVGGDLCVMDSELREPRPITSTPEEERAPAFSRDGQAIYFVSDEGGQSDIWRARRGDESKYWWQNTSFPLERLTHDSEVERRLKLGPAGERLAYVKGRGDLWTIDVDRLVATRLIRSWSEPDYDWSPDGKWLVYALSDNDFNRDIWLLPADGKGEPFNLSRHPDNEHGPVWSPDGKLIAFTGRRVDREVDLYFVWLAKQDDELSERERRLRKAVEKIEKARKKKPAKEGEDKEKESEPDGEGEEKLPEVVVDLDGIHERIRRVSIPNTAESDLFWSHDSKKLAFAATIDGRRGTYTIEIPEALAPKFLSEATGSHARWLAEGDRVVWLSGGVPGELSASGEAKAYDFRLLQEIDVPARNRAAFDLAWRTMRDSYYDERLGNRDWDAVHRKYADAAAGARDGAVFSAVIHLMLGELNGSHLGFHWRGARQDAGGDRWEATTAHLGLRFAEGYDGPGLEVRDVLPRGPSERVASHIEPGELVMAIDGVEVNPAMDLTRVLNGPLQRDVRLQVRNRAGEDREVVVRPISYSAANRLLYEKWIADNRKNVAEASEGRFGYLHVRGMNWPSFLRFEREIYAVGAGKDGLIIDVRENGGGFTTDHLLTVLMPAAHAITVPRGGGAGYPQDRRVYATWSKPVVVLCNQNSFSNAEIFSHAIKSLGRGQLVGVPTAGGVISTGGRSILDVGFLRLPFRGWFTIGDGEDMELNGAVPHHVVWLRPGDLPRGKDEQLEKAVAVLAEEVEKWRARPRPRLRKASERSRRAKL